MNLDLAPAAFRDLLDAVSVRLEHHLSVLDGLPARDLVDLETRLSVLHQPWPVEPMDVEQALTQIFEVAVPPGLQTASGAYLGYIPGGGLPHAAVADLIAGVTNRYVGVWAGAPGLATLELVVTRWLCDLVGYGPHSAGLLTTGGSLANFTAVFTARRERLGDRLDTARLYTSDQAHHSVTKAALLAGFPQSAICVVESDLRGRIRADQLATRIREHREAGLHPFLLIANGGTTNTGAIDDLHALADLAEAEDLHLHVDAAYGGFFALTARGVHLLDGLERADSITLDPHKGLFLPYGTGALVVRDGDSLSRAHRVGADYLTDAGMPGAVDLCDMGPELSREPRGLRVWLPLVLCGRRAFEEALDHKLEQAHHATERVLAWPGVELAMPTTLSVVSFHAPERDDAFHTAWLNGVLARGRVMLSATRIRGRMVLRIAVLCFRTTDAHVEAALEDLEAVYTQLTRQGGESHP